MVYVGAGQSGPPCCLCASIPRDRHHAGEKGGEAPDRGQAPVFAAKLFLRTHPAPNGQRLGTEGIRRAIGESEILKGSPILGAKVIHLVGCHPFG